MNATSHEVGIVGAGPCGLLTALLLARRGIDVVVFERKSEPLDHPKAMGISRRTAEILEQLGLRESMQTSDLAPPEYSLAIWEGSLCGAEYGRVPLQAPDFSIAPYPAFHCPQPVTERVLLGALEKEGSARVLFGQDVAAIDDDGHRVRVTTASGEVFDCRYLVAADGAGSPVRRMLGIEGIGPGDLGHFLNTYFRAAYGPHLEGRRAVLHDILRPELFEMFVAVNGDDLWLMHHFLQEGEQPADYPPERLAEIIREASGLPDVPVEILSVGPWVMSPKIATQFRKGNVFLTGDASARLSPAAGLGMNTGLQSAHNLAWKLAAVLNGAPETLLESYDAERRGHVMRTYEMSNEFGSETWEIIEAGLIGDFDRVRILVANSRRAGSGLGVDLGWHYESGAFIPESAGRPEFDPNVYHPTAEPGRRAPHVWIERSGRKTSTLEFFGDGFVLLVAGKSDSDWSADGVKVVTIPENEFAEVYGLQPGGAVLVRPDGVVGWRSPEANPSGLAPALGRILAGG